MRLEEYLTELKKIKMLDLEEEQRLWRRFKFYQDNDARQKLIESYQPLVFKAALPYRDMENVMDIIQEGTVGLIEAAESFKPNLGTAFSLYAIHRIRGRMIDFLRREFKIDEKYNLDEQEFALEDIEPTIAEQAETHDMIDKLRQAMRRLPQKERTVLESIYLQSEEAKTVADKLELSVSHIYKLQKQGIRRIRGMLSKFMRKF